MPTVSEDAWIEEFKAWVWEPPYWRLRVRGLSNATLCVRPGGFTLKPRRLYDRISGWCEITYEWPVVVLETLLPFRSPGLLFEMSGRLARCSVNYEAARLRAALERADLSVIDVKHWGWEAPRPVAEAVLGEHLAEVPAAVVRPAE